MSPSQHDQQKTPWRLLLLFWFLYALLLGWQIFSHTAFHSIDGMYHIRLARLYWEQGIFVDFPWMQFSIANEYWADHHFLFHIFLIPFSWMELSSGLRWSSVFFGSTALVSCLAYLCAHRVRHVWIYGLLLMVCSSVFLFRISMPRAMSVALIFILASLWCLETRRDKWLFVLGFGFAWWYQTAVVLLPMALCAVFWRRLTTQQWEWRPVLFTFGGVFVGFAVNPFSPDTFSFLFFHVFSVSKTSVELGQEWYASSWRDLLWLNYPAVVMGFVATFWGLKRYRSLPIDIGILAIGALALALTTLRTTRMLEYAIPFIMLFSARVFDSLLFPRKQVIPTPSLEGVENDSKQPQEQAAKDKDGQASKEQSQSTLSLSKLQRFVMALFVLSFVAAGVYYQVDLHRKAFDVRHQNTRQAALWLKQHTPKKSIVFHTDWTGFSYLFFHNSHNYYISGLTPHFFHSWKPKLYALYRHVSSGRSREPVSLIRKVFRARFVFLHARSANFPLAMQLERSPRARRVYEDKHARVYQLFDKPLKDGKKKRSPKR